MTTVIMDLQKYVVLGVDGWFDPFPGHYSVGPTHNDLAQGLIELHEKDAKSEGY